MKVLFLNHHSSLYGATRSLLNLTEGLASLGVECRVLSPSFGPATEAFQRAGVPHDVVGFEWSMGPRHEGAMPRLRRTVRNLRSLGPLRRVAARFQPEVVYSNSSVISVGRVLAVLLRRPHVWHLREMGDADYGLLPDGGPSAFRWLLSTSQALVANSGAVRDHVCGPRLGRRVRVIYNGIARRAQFDHRLANRLPDSDRGARFLCVGVIHPGKGQLTAIQALGAVVREVPDAELHLVGGHGDPRYVAQCEAAARALGIAGKVHFVGRVEDPEVHYASARALLMCSEAEAMGRVTVEAMAGGCLVIGRAAGGTLELVEHGRTGLLFDGGAEALAEQILFAMRHPGPCREIVREAHREARDRFCLETYAGSVFEVLRSVVRSPNPT